MLYHASPIGELTELRPHISNHGIPLLYFSQKRENTLVYLSKAGFTAVLFHGIGKINKGILPLLRKVQQWNAVVGNVWPQLGQFPNG